MKKIVVLLLAITFISATAQNIEFTKENFKNRNAELKEALKNISTADDEFTKGVNFYKDALGHYLLAAGTNPNNALLNYKIGLCYIYSTDKAKAAPYLEKAAKQNTNVSNEIHYWLGKAYQLTMKWDEAIIEYKTFIRLTTNNTLTKAQVELAAKELEECTTALLMVKKPERVFIDNLGENINSPFADYNPIISADETVLMFTSRRPTNIGGKKDYALNDFHEDIYYSIKKDNKWSVAVNIGKDINSDESEACANLSPDGQKLLITKNNADLYETQLEGEDWERTQKLNKLINTEFKETSACYSPDGKTLYFVSDRPEGCGGKDIYLCKKDEKGKWGKPENIGGIINTKYNEESVFMHPDGKTLYFSSEGHKGIGGYDIYKSVFDKGIWQPAENIGYPINTPADDLNFVISANGKYGYYTSINPEKGYGERDIYRITFLGPEKPFVLLNEDNLISGQATTFQDKIIAPTVLIKNVQLTLLKGVVTDAQTQKPTEAIIQIIDNAKKQVLYTLNSNSVSGKYLIPLPNGINYSIIVKHSNRLFHSENIDIPAEYSYKEVIKNISLKPLTAGASCILRNLFFDFGKASLKPESTQELERIKSLLSENKSLKIEIGGFTDSKGDADYNKQLSANRAKAVADYLVKAGIKPERITSEGYGKEQPVAGNEKEEDRKLNWRIELKITAN